MTKVRKQRRAQKYDYKKNRRNQNMREKKKNKPKIEEPALKEQWNDQRSIRFNMESMGLSFDPNKAVSKGRYNKAGSTSRHITPLPDNTSVRKALELKASMAEDVRLRLSEPDTQYAIYMLDKYGDDYKAMARDRRNYYQDTPNQIRKKINKFQNIPDLYQAYSLMKEGETLTTDTG